MLFSFRSTVFVCSSLKRDLAGGYGCVGVTLMFCCHVFFHFLPCVCDLFCAFPFDLIGGTGVEERNANFSGRVPPYPLHD